MNYRLSTLLPRADHTQDITEVVDLDMADPISQIIIELAVTNVGDVALAHAIASLAKIEIVDGSDVLFSLSGYEAEAVDIYHNRGIRSNFNTYLNGMGVSRYLGINFGRHLWDPLLAFDPTKFRNPQLKLTLEIGAGGNSSTPNSLQVWAAMFDQKSISPVGFLTHKEIKDYVMTQSGHEYTDLPTDYTYRKLLIRNLEAGAEPCQNIGIVKLSEDQDKRVVFDHTIVDLLRTIAIDHPLLVEQIMFACTTGGVSVFTTVSERATATFADWAGAVASGNYASYGSAGGRMTAICGTGATNAVAMITGYIPHGVFEIPFGDQNDIDDWYKVAEGIGSLKLDITGGPNLGGTETCQIFLQQLRPYV